MMISQPDATGHFGPYGGRFVPEVLMAPLEELERAYRAASADPGFQAELADLLANYAGRPTPLYYAKRLSETLGGAKIYLKREDLLHTGAHKINNCLGQALLARRMGKKRIIAETGAGQHGVATATVCALFGLECVVYMGEEDMRRQRLNVFRMRLLGANVVSVTNGSRTLKDAISEAMRDWVTNVHTTHYLLGSALGAHPYPQMVRDFHRVIGEETRAEILKREGRLPDSIFACVGGGSNAIGMFHAFIGDENVKLIGIEAGGRSLNLGEHAARFAGGAPGVLHGAKSYLLAGCRRAGRADAFGLGGPGLRVDRTRSMPGCTIAAAPSMFRAAIPKRWPRRRNWRGRKALFRRSNRRMRWRRRCVARRRKRVSCSSSICPGAATKTRTFIARIFRSWTSRGG